MVLNSSENYLYQLYTKLVQQIAYETLHLVKLRSILNFGKKFKIKIQVVLWSETER